MLLREVVIGVYGDGVMGRRCFGFLNICFRFDLGAGVGDVFL